MCISSGSRSRHVGTGTRSHDRLEVPKYIALVNGDQSREDLGHKQRGNHRCVLIR